MAQNSPTNPSLWMGDLAPYMDEAFIKNAFQSLGQVVHSVRILADKKTGVFGYCFVDFGEIHLAKKAYQICNNRKIPNTPPHQSKRFKLNFSFTTYMYTKEGTTSTSQALHFGADCTIHVSNLSLDVTDEQLFDYFAGRFKMIKKASVTRDGIISRGYGFVEFCQESDVTEAIKIFNCAVGLGTKPIRVGYKTTKGVPPHSTSANTPIPPKRETSPASSKQGSARVSAPTPTPQKQVESAEQHKFRALMAQYNLGFGSYTDVYTGTVDKTKDMKFDVRGAGGEEDDDPLEDPEITIDVDKSNQLIMNASEELYRAMEDSRWKVIDTINTTYSDLCKA